MVVGRGEVWWAELPDPVASAPGGRHPVLILQANSFNRSGISTTIAAVMTSSLHLAQAPGNVLVEGKEAGLSKASVVNVSQLVTADKDFLRSRCGRLKAATMARVDDGLRLIMAL